MKLLLLVFFITLAYAAPQFRRKELFGKAYKECQSDSATRGDHVALEKLRQGHDVEHDKVKNLIYCMNLKLNLQSNNGVLNKDTIQKDLADVIDDETKVKSIVEECTTHDAKLSKFEVAINTFKCLHKYTPKDHDEDSSRAEREQRLDQYKKHILACQSENATRVDESILRKVRRGEKVNDPQVNAHVFCISEKTGIMDKHGDINKETIRKDLEVLFGFEDKVTKIINECAVKAPEDSAEETAVKLYKCLHKFDFNIHGHHGNEHSGYGGHDSHEHFGHHHGSHEHVGHGSHEHGGHGSHEHGGHGSHEHGGHGSHEHGGHGSHEHGGHGSHEHGGHGSHEHGGHGSHEHGGHGSHEHDGHGSHGSHEHGTHGSHGSHEHGGHGCHHGHEHGGHGSHGSHEHGGHGSHGSHEHFRHGHGSHEHFGHGHGSHEHGRHGGHDSHEHGGHDSHEQSRHDGQHSHDVHHGSGERGNHGGHGSGESSGHIGHGSHEQVSHGSHHSIQNGTSEQNTLNEQHGSENNNDKVKK